MPSTILQVPINKNIRDLAASKAEKMGFSSLQEIVRLFLNRVAAGEISVTFEQPAVKLSAKNEKRYNKIIAEIESGEAELRSYSDVESLMNDLNDNNQT